MIRREAFMDQLPDAHVAYWEAAVANTEAGNALLSYRNHLCLAIALYSRGDDLSVVRARVRQAVSALENDAQSPKEAFSLADRKEYCLAIWGLSLSILFGDASPEFLHRGIGQDAVYDRLLQRTGAMVQPVDTLLHPQPYEHLRTAIDTPATSAESIPQFLRTWYAGMATTPWFDAHLTHAPEFFGYWAFELAAVVKLQDITDSPFATNIFYPRDLVHQRMFRTWMDGRQGEDDRKVKALMDAQDQMAAAMQMIQGFFSGTSDANPESEAKMEERLKALGNLLGFMQEGDDAQPQAIRQGMIGLHELIASASKNLLSQQPNSPEQQRLVALVKEFEAELRQDAEVNATLAETEAGMTTEEIEKIRQQKISALQGGLEKSIPAEEEGMDTFLKAMERMLEGLAKRLDVPTRPERDIREEVAEEVTRNLNEANKKNTIGPDFDWSTIWKN
ncbi:MAG: DUF1911 domain-containing protein [Bacteroidia bacterium]